MVRLAIKLTNTVTTCKVKDRIHEEAKNAKTNTFMSLKLMSKPYDAESMLRGFKRPWST